MLSSAGHLVPYAAVAVFVGGMTWRTASWLARPVPFALSLDPTPRRAAARAASMADELLLMRGLRRAQRSLWLWAMLTHASLAVILLGHLVGIPTAGREFALAGVSPSVSEALSAGLGTAAGLLFVASLLALLSRRASVVEVRRLSDPADYFDLALLLAVAVSGLLMRLPAVAADQQAIRAYLAGLLTLRPAALPASPVFLVHFALVNVLLVYAPFSKLVHATGGLLARALLLAPAQGGLAPGAPGLVRRVPR